MPDLLPQTSSPDISTSAERAETPPSGSGQSELPRGCALNVETAITYARKAKVSAESGDLALTLDRLTVVLEQLEAVSEKIKRQWVSAT